MDIELTVDALEMSPYYDHFVLFSGDGDFTALVAALQRKGKRVTVVSTLTTPTPMISDDLRRQADFFLDVAELAKTVGRPPAAERTPVDRTPRAAVTGCARSSTLPSRPSCARPEPPRTARSVRGSSPSATRTGARFPDWHNAPVPNWGDPQRRG